MHAPTAYVQSFWHCFWRMPQRPHASVVAEPGVHPFATSFWQKPHGCQTDVPPSGARHTRFCTPQRPHGCCCVEFCGEHAEPTGGKPESPMASDVVPVSEEPVSAVDVSAADVSAVDVSAVDVSACVESICVDESIGVVESRVPAS